jgi:hypothetical protein
MQPKKMLAVSGQHFGACVLNCPGQEILARTVLEHELQGELDQPFG